MADILPIPRYCSKPVTVAASKPIFQLGALILSGYFLFWVYQYGTMAATRGALTSWRGSSLVRFRVFGLRDQALPVDLGNPYVFGLLQDGCPFVDASQNRTFDAIGNGSQPAIIKLNEPTPFVNGYSLMILSGPSTADPVKWAVEIAHNSNAGHSETAGNEWSIVAASFQQGTGSSASFLPNVSYSVPVNRGDRIQIDLRRSWPWVLIYITAYAVPATGWLLYCIAGLLECQDIAKIILACAFAISAGLEGAGAVGFHLVGAWREAVDGLLYLIPDAILFLGLCFAERHMLYILEIFGLISIAGTVLRFFINSVCFLRVSC